MNVVQKKHQFYTTQRAIYFIVNILSLFTDRPINRFLTNRHTPHIYKLRMSTTVNAIATIITIYY